MRYGYLFFGLAIVALAACDKHDPILPGVRTDIFDNNDINVLNMEIPTLSETQKNIYGDENCDYV